MKNTRNFILSATVAVGILASSVTAFAIPVCPSPAELVAKLTSRSLESVIQEKINNGVTYGCIANTEDVLDEFKSEILDIKKDNLDTKVENGYISQEKADQIFEIIKDKQSTCDGTGNQDKTQCGLGIRFGTGEICDKLKEEILGTKKDNLDTKVESGYISQEKADEIFEIIKERQENCDGTRTCNQDGLGLGLGFGNGNSCGNGLGNGSGLGKGCGNGIGFGNGNGNGFGNGSCLAK